MRMCIYCHFFESPHLPCVLWSGLRWNWLSLPDDRCWFGTGTTTGAFPQNERTTMGDLWIEIRIWGRCAEKGLLWLRWTLSLRGETFSRIKTSRLPFAIYFLKMWVYVFPNSKWYVCMHFSQKANELERTYCAGFLLPHLPFCVDLACGVCSNWKLLRTRDWHRRKNWWKDYQKRN